MNGWRGLLAGALGLAALEVAVSSQASAERAGGIFSTLGAMARRFLDPGVPAFSKAASSSSSSSGTSIGGAIVGGLGSAVVPDPNRVQNDPNKGQFSGGGASGSWSPSAYPSPQTIQVPPGTRVVSA